MQDETSNPSSATPATDAASALRFGPFHVSTAHAEVEAFRRETGWPDTKSAARSRAPLQVPHTFPMRWLASPGFRNVLETKLKSLGGIAFHESQSFTYENPLDPDRDYLMTADLDHQMNPERLIVRAYIVTPRDEPCLQMETILRIVGTGGAAP
jgi:hypothetical protein